MLRRQSLPQLWMMTDERQGDLLWPALERLPRGAGIVFRHYGLLRAERRAAFERVRRIAARRRLLLLVAGAGFGARAWHVEGTHGRRGAGLRSASAHDSGELRAAERSGADLVFLSPVFATRSHPEGRALGPLRFALLARQTRLPVIALGGMSETRARRLDGTAMYGWAAIDTWTPAL